MDNQIEKWDEEAVKVIKREDGAESFEFCYAPGDEGGEFCGDPKDRHCSVVGNAEFWRSAADLSAAQKSIRADDTNRCVKCGHHIEDWNSETGQCEYRQEIAWCGCRCEFPSRNESAASVQGGPELSMGYARIRGANSVTHDVTFACAACNRRQRQSTRQPQSRVINGHVLLTKATCNITHDQDGQCPVCDGGLAVCANCPEYEAGLDNPCQPSSHPMTAPHDSATDQLVRDIFDVTNTPYWEEEVAAMIQAYCSAQADLTGTHDSATCALGANGGPCGMCAWATPLDIPDELKLHDTAACTHLAEFDQWAESAYPPQATYDLSEQQRQGAAFHRAD